MVIQLLILFWGYIFVGCCLGIFFCVGLMLDLRVGCCLFMGWVCGLLGLVELTYCGWVVVLICCCLLCYRLFDLLGLWVYLRLIVCG